MNDFFIWLNYIILWGAFILLIGGIFTILVYLYALYEDYKYQKERKRQEQELKPKKALYSYLVKTKGLKGLQLIHCNISKKEFNKDLKKVGAYVYKVLEGGGK